MVPRAFQLLRNHRRIVRLSLAASSSSCGVSCCKWHVRLDTAPGCLLDALSWLLQSPCLGSLAYNSVRKCASSHRDALLSACIMHLHSCKAASCHRLLPSL